GPGWAEQSHPLRQKRKTPPRGAFCVSDGEDWVRTHPGSTNLSGTNSDDRRSAPSAARGEAQDGPSNPTLSARNAERPLAGRLCWRGGRNPQLRQEFRGVHLRYGRSMTRSLPLGPPPQKKWSGPAASSPETPVPAGISRRSSTVPVSGSMCRTSLVSFSQVPCQSSPSTQVTPVTKRSEATVRSTAPVSGSIW